MITEDTATTTETTAPAAEPAAASTTEASETPEEGSETPKAEVPPAYQVNPTFKVRNQEQKFEDWLLPHIKDAESEKKARELHEKAYGLEFVKQDRESLQGRVQQLTQVVEQEYAPLRDTVQKVVHFRDQKNLPAVFQLIGLPPQEVFQWAVQYAEMDPNARAMAMKGSTTELQAFEAQNQAMTQQQQQAKMAADLKMRELDMMVTYNPQVSASAAEIEQRLGHGAFKQQVIQYGLTMWHTQGREVSVEEAVQHVLKLFGGAGQAQPQTIPGQGVQSSNPMANPMGTTPQVPKPLPVIPNIQGNGTSPAKRVYSSMDDIRKRRQELEASGD